MSDLAPHGSLRIALNLGNPAVVMRDAGKNELQGIAIDLSRALAEECGLQLEYVLFASAGQLVDAGNQDAWDVAFLAIEQQRRETLSFTPPYKQIQGHFMVRAESPIQVSQEIDTPGSVVAVTAGSAYDAFLTRHLRHARLQRHPSSTDSFNALMREGADAAAGVTLALKNFAIANPGARILKTPFMAIDQALAISKRRIAGAKYLFDFISRKIDQGRVGG